MGALILPSRFNQQPQHAAAIDWSNPITRGLVFAHVPATLPNASPLVTRYGIAARRPTIAPEYGNRPASQNIPELTVLGVALRNGTSNANSGQFFLRLRNSGNSNQTQLGLGLEPYQSNNRLSFSVAYGDYATSNIAGAFPAAAAGQRTVVIGTHSVSSGVMDLWADNGLIATGPAPNKTLFNTNVSAMVGDAGGGTENTGAPNLLNAMWTRVLSAAEIKSITENPWQLFKAPMRRLWVAPVATGPVSGAVAASEGSDTLAAAGASSFAPITGAASNSESADTLAAAGSVSSAPITGTMAAGEAPDTLAAFDQAQKPTAGGGGGGSGSVREVHAFAQELDRARKPTKGEKKRRKQAIEAAVLELLPHEPAAELAVPYITQLVARSLPPATWAPVRAMQPITLPVAVLDAARARVHEWLALQVLLDDIEDELETELLLMG